MSNLSSSTEVPDQFRFSVAYKVVGIARGGVGVGGGGGSWTPETGAVKGTTATIYPQLHAASTHCLR